MFIVAVSIVVLSGRATQVSDMLLHHPRFPLLGAVACVALLSLGAQQRGLHDEHAQITALFLCTQENVDAYLREHPVDDVCPRFDEMVFETCIDRVLYHRTCVRHARSRGTDGWVIGLMLLCFIVFVGAVTAT